MILHSDNRKNLVLGAISAIGLVWLFFAFVVSPMTEKSERLDRKISKAQIQLEEISKTADDFLRISALAPRGTTGGAPISTEVQKHAGALGIRDKIKRMTPIPGLNNQPPELGLAISDISLPVLVDFLKRLYESPMAVNVKLAKIKTVYEKRNRLEVELTLTRVF